MAEAIVGVAASGAGLASLAIQLLQSTQTIREFHGRVKNAPDTLLNLSHDLETVSLMLRQLETHRQHDTYDAELLGRCMSRCQRSVTQMESLVRKLESRLSRLHILGKIMVAVRDDEFRSILGDLEQAKSSIMLAFQMYSFSRQTQQYQQHRAGLSQLRSAAENGYTTLLAEVRQFGTSTWKQSSGDKGAGRVVELDEPCPIDPNSLQRFETFETDGSEPENCVLTKRQNRKHWKKQYHCRINFAWLTGRMWDIAAGQAETGWDIRMRAWNLRPPNSEIFLACEYGDLPTVKKLLQSGEASIYDLSNDPRGYSRENGYSLLNAAAENGRLDICRFLLTETRLSEAGIADSALIGAIFRSPGNTTLAFYTLFIEHSDSDTDFDKLMARSESVQYDDIGFWLRWCVYEDCKRLIQRSQSSSYFARPLQQYMELTLLLLVEIDIGYLHHPLIWSAAHQITRELALFQGVNGKTILHMVAESIGRNLSQNLSPDHVLHAVFDLVSLGADVSAVWGEGTPFIHLIDSLETACCQTHSEIKLGEAVKLWITILQRCEVHLPSYARTEQAIWRHSESSGSFVLGQKRLKARRIVFDENSGSWDLEVLSQDLVPIYESHSIPGAWVPDIPEISKICWVPSVAEQNECKWVLTDDVRVKSAPWIIREAAGKRVTPAYEILLTNSQDDHGIIALRVNKRKPSARLRRRGSMPHLLGMQAFDRRCRRSRIFGYHPWLPRLHLCPYDGKLRFDCDTTDGEPNFRACAQGASIRESCMQETWRWDRFHFDGQAVQDFRRRVERECPVRLEESLFLSDDGRWVSTETWKTIKVCEPGPWWFDT